MTKFHYGSVSRAMTNTGKMGVKVYVVLSGGTSPDLGGTKIIGVFLTRASAEILVEQNPHSIIEKHVATKIVQPVSQKRN